LWLNRTAKLTSPNLNCFLSRKNSPLCLLTLFQARRFIFKALVCLLVAFRRLRIAPHQRSNKAPTVKAVSAKLKIGQTLRSMKSVTAPNLTRSSKFPTAPPNIMPIAIAILLLSKPCRPSQRKTALTNKATMISNMVAFGNKPKAAPGF